jgi:hypothetical protein
VQLLPDELVTKIIIHSIKDEPIFHFLNLRNKICGTFRRICDSDVVLLHLSLRDLRWVIKNCYVGCNLSSHRYDYDKRKVINCQHQLYSRWYISHKYRFCSR